MPKPNDPQSCILELHPQHSLTLLPPINGESSLPTNIFIKRKGQGEGEGEGEGEIHVGILPGNSPVPPRWHDVDLDVQPTSKKAKLDNKPVEEREDQRTQRLLSQLPLTMRLNPAYTQTPFPHGTKSIESLTLVGASKFETIMTCYNHWFGHCSIIDRFTRECRLLNIGSLSLYELEQMESESEKLWKSLHTAMVKRKSSVGAQSVR